MRVIHAIGRIIPVIVSRKAWRDALETITRLEAKADNLASQVNHLTIHSDNLASQVNHLTIHSTELSEEIVSLKRDSFFGIVQEPLVESTTSAEFNSLLRCFKISPCYLDFRRIGSIADGGYIVPALSSFSACFSAGVETNVDFELEIAEQSVKTYLIDFSIDHPPQDHNLFHFTKKVLSGTSSNSGTFVSLSDWIDQHEPGAVNLLVKIDVEGSEWEIIENTQDQTLSKIAVLIIEFHWLEAVRQKPGFEKTKLVFEKLLQTFDLVHVHPNNCSTKIEVFGKEMPQVFEATFISKSLNQKSNKTYSGFHLDHDNCVNRPSISLDQFWFSE
jgi:hypothetical protein